MRIGKLTFDSCKSEPLPILMSLYTEAEKFSGSIPQNRWDDYFSVEPEDAANDRRDVFEYGAPAAVIAERLDLLGFTTQLSFKAFEVGLRQQVRDRKNSLSTIERFEMSQPAQEQYASAIRDEISFLENDLSSQRWMKALIEIRTWCEGLRSFRELREHPALSPIASYIVRSSSQFGFPGYLDPRFALRLALESLESDDVVYDLTDLYLGEEIDSDMRMSDIATTLLSHEDRIARRVIVLTEGSTDKWALQRSIRLLAPEIAEFFAFMDFEGAKVEGGAHALASLVKAFVGAGIENRIVAMFDNDTAGSVALRKLSAITLPKNIVALKYPKLPLAENYPTVGPNGTTIMDVNGMACSLELYLGSDVLTNNKNVLSPVHWKSFDPFIGRYQGEISEKKLVLEKFDNKLAMCENDSGLLRNYDWSGLRLIIRMMKSAFHHVDAEELLVED